MTFKVIRRPEPAFEAIIDPWRPIIDAHHHFWGPGDPFDYDHIDFARDIRGGHNILGSVFVECTAQIGADGPEAMKPVRETEFVANAATTDGIAAAIVGWADLSQPAVAAETLDAHIAAGRGRFRGVRHNVIWHAHGEMVGPRKFPRHLLLDTGFRQGLREVARRGLSYDVWLFHEQLPELAEAADSLPDLMIILDHLGGPATADTSPAGRRAMFESWRNAMMMVAERPNILLKLGGLGMPVYGLGFDSRTARPTGDELATAWEPYVDAAINIFGCERCMFESNFPVDKQSFSYTSGWNAFKRLTASYSETEKHALFFGTASQAYKIGAV